LLPRRGAPGSYLMAPCRGRGECRARQAHPQPRVGKIKPHERSHHGRAGITRHSRTRMVLTTYSALSPVAGLSCHRRLRKLLAKTWHRDIRTTRLRRPHATSLVRQCAASIASRAQRLVTIVIRPSSGRDNLRYMTDLGGLKSFISDYPKHFFSALPRTLTFRAR
jgi:hypothetical protein